MVLSGARREGFTLIELLVVILIIGILVAVSAPSFLGQTQKAHDSASKQELAVAYRAAKAVATDRDGDFTTSSFDAAALASQIEDSEPELVLATGSCPDVAAGQPDNYVYVDTTGTSSDSLELCDDPGATVWTLTVVHGGPPQFSSTSVAAAASVPVRHKLVFECAGATALCVMNDDGSDETQVPNTGSGDSSPALSPDESTIVFVRHNNVYSVKTDGSDLTQVTILGAVTSVSLSPDGTRMTMAYQYAYDNNHNQIFVLDSDGGGCCQLLTNTADAENFLPSWGGDKVAFLSTRDGAPSVYVENANGSGGEIKVATDSDSYAAVSMSPDDTKVAAMDVSGEPEIYVLPLDGSSKTAVTTTAEGANFNPSWSPDGTKVAFEHDVNGVPQIAVANADGSGFTVLTNDASGDSTPNWR